MSNAAPSAGHCKAPLVSFYRFIPDCRLPQRADRSAAGTLPTRAFRYCEAVCTASAYGWYVFPPIGFSLIWDGSDVLWTYDGAESWYNLHTAQYPGFSSYFDSVAPPKAQAFAPPFLSSSKEPGLVQVWSGLAAQTAPGWSLLIRPLANLPRSQNYELYEGIVETDRWFGPLFVTLRLTRTNVPIEFCPDFPLIQVQPLPRNAYEDQVFDRFEIVQDPRDFGEQVWDAYHRTVVQPCSDPERQRGRYAVATRRRQREAANLSEPLGLPRSCVT